jgi:hypothetical protein
MKQIAVEWLINQLGKSGFDFSSHQGNIQQAKEIEKQQQGYSEEEMLKMLHKFGFDYTYNYKGEKTIYEWIPEWFEEYKRLEQLNKQDMIITITNKDGLNQISKFSENKIKHITETNQWGYVINTILKNSNK